MFFMFPIFSVSLSVNRQNDEALELGFQTLHVHVVELGISIRVVLPTFQIFLVGFEGKPLGLQDTADSSP
jgi:hypothetical protein